MVIDLSDGSMVVVSPESIVTLKDYRAAASLRELFGITLGMVRVKINHFAGKPNPYRMNSPTASIAVRGTEFSIEVDAEGATQVVVYEGAVEVASLADPDRRVLIEAGRGVLVQGGQDFHLIGAHPAAARQPRRGRPQRPAGTGQTRATGQRARARRAAAARCRVLHRHPRKDPFPKPLPARRRMPNTIATIRRAPARAPTTAISRASPISRRCRSCFASTPSPKRTWTAWRIPPTPPNSAVPKAGCSSCRPSAAHALFRNTSPRSAQAAACPATTASHRRSPTSRLQAPSPSAAALRYRASATTTLTAAPDYEPGSLEHNPQSSPQTSGSSSGTFYSAALVAARRFGANSFGVELATLKGTGSISSVATEPMEYGRVNEERSLSTSDISQTRLTAGFSRDLSRNMKFGLFYRYAFIHADDHDVSRTINDLPLGLNATRTAGHSSEFGVRLRGMATPRLSYGFAAAWLGISLLDGMNRIDTVDSHERDRAQRVSTAIGVGYALTQRTTLSFDLAGGNARTWASRHEDSTGALLQDAAADSRFVSAHAAVQSDITRRLFLTASFLNVWQAHSLNVSLFPDRFGEVTNVEGAFFSMNPAAGQYASRFSDFGAGWRFTRNLFAQYVYSTDYGASSATHTLMVRYTFHPRD